MRRILPLPLVAALLAISLAGAPVQAQQPAQQGAPPDQGEQPNWPPGLQNWDTSGRDPEGGNPNEAEQRGLTSPEVKESMMPGPTAQGTRPPESDDVQDRRAALYDAIRAVRRAPPALDGRPIPRPNPLASEPEVAMQPDPAGNPESLFPENYVE